MHKGSITVLITSLIILAACEVTPMQKLKSDKKHDELTAAYWFDQQQNNPALYQDAVQYCKVNPQKPNCTSVNATAIVNNVKTTARKVVNEIAH